MADDSAPVKRKRDDLQEKDGSDANKDNNKIISGDVKLLPLQPSIFNITPVPDIQRVVANFIRDQLRHPIVMQALTSNTGDTEVEIEAKLGRFVYCYNRLNTGRNNIVPGARISLPVFCETPIDMSDIRFESDMTMKQHRHYNDMLNRLYEQRSSRLKYTHTREVDRYFREGGDRGTKTRGTFSQTTNELLRVIKKQTIGHLNVYSPLTALDYRISVNIEQKAELPKNVQSMFQRKKDRIMYSHELVQVDLTQVMSNDKKPNKPVSTQSTSTTTTAINPNSNPYRQAGAPPPASSQQSVPPDDWHTTFELEIEFLNVRRHLFDEQMKIDKGLPSSRLLDNVGIFLNTVKLLAVKATDDNTLR